MFISLSQRGEGRVPKTERHHSPLASSHHSSQLPMLSSDLILRMWSWDTGQDTAGLWSSHCGYIEGTIWVADLLAVSWELISVKVEFENWNIEGKMYVV